MNDFYKYILPEDLHKKISEAIIAMISTGYLPYYGEFALFISFYESKNNPYLHTAGVNSTPKGLNFYWDRKFFDNLTQSETNFIVIHEIMHLLFDHIKRSYGYDKSAANIVQDMIINQIIYDEIMMFTDNNKTTGGYGIDTKDRPAFITIPKDKLNNNSALFIPKEYGGKPIFEELYEWYMKKKTKMAR